MQMKVVYWRLVEKKKTKIEIFSFVIDSNIGLSFWTWSKKKISRQFIDFFKHPFCCVFYRFLDDCKLNVPANLREGENQTTLIRYETKCNNEPTSQFFSNYDSYLSVVALSEIWKKSDSWQHNGYSQKGKHVYTSIIFYFNKE